MPTETSQLVQAAVAAGLRVAPQSTGHNAGPLGRLDDVVIIRTSAMTHIDIDPVRQVATVGGGALWLPVVEAAAAHGFAVLHGSSPDVGVAGYSLGGGIFMYARKLGMQTNNITGLEVVTADGSILWASDTENAELFWALRGGGGSFGIVTALEFSIFPFQDAYAGMLVWDRTETERVLRRWVQWAGDAPDEVTTSFRVLNLPPLPDIPEAFRGRQLVIIDGAVLASDERSVEILAALRDARARDRHVRPGAGAGAGPAAHGSGGPDPGRLEHRAAGRDAGGCHPGVRRARPARVRRPPC